MALNEGFVRLDQQIQEQEKESRRLKREDNFLKKTSIFFCREPSEVSRNKRVMMKTQEKM